MRNYAEEIAYLYFRLNGFFLLDNYVTHAGENENRMHTDSDILGIKTNLVKESVGLVGPNDIDKSLDKIIGGYSYIGLLCEVKGGVSNDWIINDNRILPCVKRMGLLEEGEVDTCVSQLKKSAAYISKDEKTIIVKVVATNNSNEETNKKWYLISLNEMSEFIQGRAKKYLEKQRGWNFYASNLFQYILKSPRP